MKTKLQGNNKLFTSSKRSGSARTVKYTTQWRTLREVHDSVAHARSSTTQWRTLREVHDSVAHAP